MTLNIMMDPRDMYPNMYHPCAPDTARDWNGPAKFYSRTRRPSKYFWIDFGLSCRYDENAVSPQEIPIIGGDRTVPEFQGDEDTPRDPFLTDIYTLGNIVREDFLEVSFLLRS